MGLLSAFINLFMPKVTFLTMEDEHSFVIDSLSGKEGRQIAWKDISDISFGGDHSRLSLHLHTGKKIRINQDALNWEEFILTVPQGKYRSFDYPYVNTIRQGLQDCKVCGKVAVHDGMCLSCGNFVWGHELVKDYPDETSYLKQMQLELYDTGDPDEPVDLSPPKDRIFKPASNYRLLVTKEEVKEYGRLNV